MNPSAEATALAVKLSGHISCQTGPSICEGCLGDAATIDRELQLPALLLAETKVSTDALRARAELAETHVAALQKDCSDLCAKLMGGK